MFRSASLPHFAKGPPEVKSEDVLFLLTIAQAGMWPFGFSALVGGLFAVPVGRMRAIQLRGLARCTP